MPGAAQGPDYQPRATDPAQKMSMSFGGLIGDSFSRGASRAQKQFLTQQDFQQSKLMTTFVKQSQVFKLQRSIGRDPKCPVINSSLTCIKQPPVVVEANLSLLPSLLCCHLSFKFNSLRTHMSILTVF